MTIAAADTNGGRYNTVHNQTDDGLVFSVAYEDGLLPLSFSYCDYLGDKKTSLISWGHYPHRRLMRGDCGWRAEDDSVAITLSWNGTRKVVDGLSQAPSGEFVENWHEVPTCATNALTEALRGHRRQFYRKDREYWTPDNTVAGEAWAEFFGPTQWNPQACPPKAPNDCGLVEYEEEA